eukprot:gene3775-biopygen3712
MTPEDAMAIVMSQRQQDPSLMGMVRTLPEDRDREPLERNEPQQRIMDMTTSGASVPRILNAPPSLSDMLKGVLFDQYDSGRESKDDSSWQEFRGGVALSCRHRQFATKFSAALPTLSDLEEAACDHWDNVLATDKGATGTALGLAQDMLTRGEVECKTYGEPADDVEDGAADSSFAGYGTAVCGLFVGEGTVKGTSLQPYLSAINGFQEDLHYPGPAKGQAVTQTVKGMTALTATEQQGTIVTERTWLPASAVRQMHEAAGKMVPGTDEMLELLRACVYVVVAFVTFGKPQMGTAIK